jgi:hypothetical protein
MDRVGVCSGRNAAIRDDRGWRCSNECPDRNVLTRREALPTTGNVNDIRPRSFELFPTVSADGRKVKNPFNKRGL